MYFLQHVVLSISSKGLPLIKEVLDIVSCTNARASDFAAAAKVFKDAAEANGGNIPKIADGVKLYIAAASASEQEAAEAAGDWQALLDAGAQPMPSGCAQCIGLGPGLLEAGEVRFRSIILSWTGNLSIPDRNIREQP